MSAPAPLAGLRVVEVALGVSAVGAGMAANLPGALLRDLGADVAHVQSSRRSTLDAGIEFERAWNRGKEIVEVDDEGARAPIAALASDADIVLVTGAETVVEQEGIGYRALARANPQLVVMRIRPSFNAAGSLPDLELLVTARAGVPTQIRSHHRGPAFPDLQIASAGAALTATVGALASCTSGRRPA